MHEPSHDDTSAAAHSAAASDPDFPDTQPDPGLSPEARGAATPQLLKVEFTGSGSEYFRIWIVNLLLTIVTLTLYRPFAKARRLAYFHGNTLVGGQPLGFHGDPWKMLRGYLLMLVFAGAYGAASQFSPIGAMVAIGFFIVLWPALWRASLQFRLANTSWRGLRTGFTGSLGGAYYALLPGVLPSLGFIAFALMMQPEKGDPASAAPVAPPNGAMAVLGLSMLAMLLLMPLSLAWVKRYQHDHYRYAGEQTRLDTSVGSFYLLALKIFGVSLAVGIVGAIAAALVLLVFGGIGAATGQTGQMMLVGGVIAGLIGYGTYFVFTMPYAQSRLQNLVWGHTRSASLRCRSDLKMLPLGMLTLTNLLLVICTLGLYWPFAAIATARMRLSAVSVELDGDLSQWQTTAATGQADATGDAAGDFFGIDMGL
ncbi:YjgN family protein [Ideonella sp. DXS29W]|uniref:YjgN family protein n=1 Tax=Ideonella lacteola TaxID=2984193 RepID=A0ABU9BK71_9BURK